MGRRGGKRATFRACPFVHTASALRKAAHAFQCWKLEGDNALSNRLVLQVCSCLVLNWKETRVSKGKSSEMFLSWLRNKESPVGSISHVIYLVGCDAALSPCAQRFSFQEHLPLLSFSTASACQSSSRVLCVARGQRRTSFEPSVECGLCLELVEFH